MSKKSGVRPFRKYPCLLCIFAPTGRKLKPCSCAVKTIENMWHLIWEKAEIQLAQQTLWPRRVRPSQYRPKSQSDHASSHRAHARIQNDFDSGSAHSAPLEAEILERGLRSHLRKIPGFSHLPSIYPSQRHIRACLFSPSSEKCPIPTEKTNRRRVAMSTAVSVASRGEAQAISRSRGFGTSLVLRCGKSLNVSLMIK